MGLFLDINYRLIQRLRGERVYDALDHLEKSQWCEKDKIADTQWHQIKAIVSHAYKNVPYYQFSVRHGKKILKCYVHRLIAFQKFGDQIFKTGIVVRHLNCNSLDNSESNIEIGSQFENKMD